MDRPFDLPRLRLYRFGLVLVVSAIIVGTPHTPLAIRLGAAIMYCGLGTLTIFLPAYRGRGPSASWFPILLVDMAAHGWILFRMGDSGAPFVVLLAIPVLVWGLLHGLAGGWTSAVCAGLITLWYGASGTTDPLDSFAVKLSGSVLRAIAFLLLGTCSGFLGRRLLQNATDFRETKRELEQARLDAMSIVSCLTSGVLCFDGNGLIRQSNAKANEWLSILDFEPGQALETLYGADESLRRTLGVIRELLDSQQPATRETSVTSSGRIIPLEVSSSPILDDRGRYRGMVVLLSDLTERMERERERNQRDRLALIGQLSAGLAHEIRNSLKPITGSVELLRSDDLDANGPESHLMEIILREADNLESFLTEFLAFARDKTLQVAPIPLERVVEEEAEALATVTSRTIHVIRPEEEPVGSALCIADRSALGQVIRNLGLNGLEASEDDSPLELGWRWIGEDAEVFVRDRGVGISQEVADHAFDPFFTTKAHGTGLGLAIARDLVERQGGRLTLEPAETGGTMARIRLRRESRPTFDREDSTPIRKIASPRATSEKVAS